jgi:hypothetical protein
MGQAFVEGTNLVLAQYRAGLEWDKCCVALLLSNGQLFQFGFVALLKPACPVLYVTTNVLDACDEQGCAQVAEVCSIIFGVSSFFSF